MFPARQSSVEGRGIGLGRFPLIESALQTGMLIAPFDLRIQSNAAYYVTTASTWR
jgi:LysR family glycine cleavage system transcriptional activator